MNARVTLSIAAALLLGSSSPAVCSTLKETAVFDATKTEFPESIAIDRFGALYASLSDVGKIRKVAPNGDQSDFAVLPDVDVLGLAFDSRGNLAAAARQGIWKIRPSGEAVLFATVPGHVFLNDLTYDSFGNLYVTDDFKIWKIDTRGVATIWSEDPLFQPKEVLDPFPWPVGVNGIAFSHDRRVLFVSNTSRGQILAIPVHHDGTAGSASVLASDPLLFGADGVRTAENGDLYVAVNFGHGIVRISKHGVVSTLAEGGLLSSPTSLVISHSPRTESLYICNNDYFFGSATRPGILQLDLSRTQHPGPFPAPWFFWLWLPFSCRP